MDNIFNFNTTEIEIEEFENSKIYSIRNFYQNPDKILHLLDTNQPSLWKSWEKPSFNGIMFNDERHEFEHHGMTAVTGFLSSVCGQPASQESYVITNKTKFIDYEFNDYYNFYWAPHHDLGYTALIYLNEKEDTGTNLYKCTGIDNWLTPEHYTPWRPKSEYSVIKNIKAEFNKLVLFDGKKFLHGMSIDNDDFFKTPRLNQAIFFLES